MPPRGRGVRERCHEMPEEKTDGQGETLKEFRRNLVHSFRFPSFIHFCYLLSFAISFNSPLSPPHPHDGDLI